jgi:hypothetical protein
MPSDRTGLLTIRAYVEPLSTSPLRAEVRLTADVSQGIQRTVALADPDRVVELVRAWLRDIVVAPIGTPAPKAS